jgi:hypothetical protein
VTVWECWSRFLEDGGRAGLSLVAAVLTVAAAARLGPAGTAPGNRLGNRAAHGAALS